MSSQGCYSIVDYHSKQEKDRCGYCKCPNSSYSYGMTSQSLTVQHYQNLIDRGWRRSGCYCYKPMMKTTCCPHYTIRSEALSFKISKSQKKIVKRMLKFLHNQLTKKDEKPSHRNADSDMVIRSMDFPTYSKYTENAEEIATKMVIASVPEELSKRLNSESSDIDSNVNKKSKNSASSLPEQLKEKKQSNVNSSGYNPHKGPQKKAKLIRLERFQKKLLDQGKTQEEINTIMYNYKKRKQEISCKTLEDLLDEINNAPNRLELKLVRVMSEEFLNTFDNSAELFSKYQMAIHKDKLHECDKSSFFGFLVKSPLQEWKPENGPPQGYGSFHEQYWLNGQLIAVGVVDILPFCVSSVYFFYDPAYSFLSLGTFSSLREIYLTRQLHKNVPNLKYYYMGFYIHSCSKMRYKAKMKPSFLLCPESYAWCDIEKCLPKLDISKYSRLNEDLTTVDEDGIVDIQQVLVLYRRQVMRYRDYKRCVPFSSVEDEIKEYSSLVGKNCAYNMFLYIDE